MGRPAHDMQTFHLAINTKSALLGDELGLTRTGSTVPALSVCVRTGNSLRHSQADL